MSAKEAKGLSIREQVRMELVRFLVSCHPEDRAETIIKGAKVLEAYILDESKGASSPSDKSAQSCDPK